MEFDLSGPRDAEPELRTRLWDPEAPGSPRQRLLGTAHDHGIPVRLTTSGFGPGESEHRIVTPEPQAVLFDGLSSLELEESQPIIYDRPIGMRMLYQDPVSGAEHYLIRYPAGLQARSVIPTRPHTRSSCWRGV